MPDQKPTLDYGRHTRQSSFETKRHAIDNVLVCVAIAVVVIVLSLFGSVMFTRH